MFILIEPLKRQVHNQKLNLPQEAYLNQKDYRNHWFKSDTFSQTHQMFYILNYPLVPKSRSSDIQILLLQVLKYSQV